MRKYIVGAVFGFLLSIAISAHAEVISMIGKAVDGSFPLLINGQKSDKDAITIEGTSYIPVRAAGALFGYDVSFLDSQVILKPKEGVVNVDKLKAYQDSLTNDPERIKFVEEGKARVKAEQDRINNQQAEIQAQSKANLEAAAKIKAEGDAEVAKIKAELERRAQEAAQQQAQQQQTQPQPSLTK